MPAPFAMPPTRITAPGMVSSRAASFGAASVVVIASAAAAPPSGDSAASAASIPAITRGIGSGTPITPVAATSTSVTGTPSCAATRAVICSASHMPCGPVAALAFPLEITTARARPCAICRRESVTGAATVALRVNTAAADTVSLAATIAMSGRPEALIPAATPAARKPRGNVTPTATVRAPSIRPSLRYQA